MPRSASCAASASSGTRPVERPLRERRPVVRQAGADHRHGDALLAEAGGARIPRDTVADDDHRGSCTQQTVSRARPPRR